MIYIAIIEIPKGSDRRIHKAYDGTGFVDLGPIKDHISINNGVMPVHYGFIEHTLNVVDKDEVDVIVFSNNAYKTGDRCTIEIIGMLTREDGDHKVIAVDESVTIKSFSDLIKEEQDLIISYIGYKSKVISVDDKKVAEKYVQSCLIQSD
jgi:inorganic pyrophosphatase